MKININNILLLVLLSFQSNMFSQTPYESYGGTYKLDNGQELTGGYMVENGKGIFLFKNLYKTSKLLAMEKTSDNSLVSFDKKDTLEFSDFKSGFFNKILWKKEGSPFLNGERIIKHTVKEIIFDAKDGLQLKGNLSLPIKEYPVPVVILVHGSKAANRYLGPYIHFFIKNGYGVLAYDKRNFTENKTDWVEPDLKVLGSDAAAAMNFLKNSSDNRINKSKLGYFGGSQGGWTSSIASSISKPDFLIVKAGSGVTHGENILHESKMELVQDGVSGYELENAIHLLHNIYKLAEEGGEIEEIDSISKPFVDTDWFKNVFGKGYRPSNNWWDFLKKNNSISSIPYLKKFDFPILWFLADKDENVPFIPSYLSLKEAFSISPGKDETIIVMENSNHSFSFYNEEGERLFKSEFWIDLEKWLHTYR